MQLMPDQNQKQYYETTQGGFRFATSVCGALLGQGADIILCDDPHNILEAESDAVRSSVVDWWREGVSSRLNDPKTGCKVIIQQRVHEADLAGEMLRDGYHALVLPAEYDSTHPYCSPADVRSVDGDLLWPERFGRDELYKLKRSLGSYAAAGQLQQLPAPREGGMFRKTWFRVIEPSQIPVGGILVRGWDMAASEGSDAAYTVGVLMMKFGDMFYILDLVRFRASAGETENRIRAIVSQDGMKVRQQSFPIDPGAAGKLEARNLGTILKGYPLHFSPESGAKEVRAQGFAAQAEIGNVCLVRGDWNDEFLHEASLFPNSKYKDQIDACSRAFHSLVQISATMLDGMITPPICERVSWKSRPDLMSEPVITLADPVLPSVTADVVGLIDINDNLCVSQWGPPVWR